MANFERDVTGESRRLCAEDAPGELRELRAGNAGTWTAGERRKPFLTVEQQIAHLKEKGVTFNLCDEYEAADYLTGRTYYFKLAAYRVLFERRVGGTRDGTYVNLDFGHLVALASVDRMLRYALLPLTLDVEHAARAKLMRGLGCHPGEDGYGIVADYLASLNHDNRRRREGEIRMLGADAYCGDLVRSYPIEEMPLWVFLELVSFGGFISAYLFCARRWDDLIMKSEHYMLRQAKAVRNAAAHSTDIVNGFVGGNSSVKTDPLVMEALSTTGISRRVRAAKMRNVRLQQITTLLYLHVRLVTTGTGRKWARESLARLSREMERVMALLPHNDAVRSSFGFLVTLFDKWF